MEPSCPACGADLLIISKYVGLDDAGAPTGHRWEQINCLCCGCQWSPVVVMEASD